MLKRLYSKRSGFTLVEIIVAIAVFAVMSTMIAGIMQMASTQRRRNNEYGQQLADQEKLLAQVMKDGNDYKAEFDGDPTLAYGDYNLTFTDKTSTAYDVKLAYAVKGADGSDTAEGINYFVSPVPYDGVFDGSGASGGGQVGGGSSTSSAEYTGSLSTSLADARICASRGMEYVQIISVQKVGTPSAGAAVRYVFKTKASSNGMTEQDKAYAEYRLYFYMDGQPDEIRSSKIIVGTKTDGSKFEYTQDVPLAANIIEAGYCDNSGNPVSHSSGAPTVRTSGANTVRIGVPFFDDGGDLQTNNNFAGTGFVGETTTFYVDFEQDPGITTQSFGAAGTTGVNGAAALNAAAGGANGVGGTYTRCKIPTTNGYENVFVYGGYNYIIRDTDGNIITSL